MPLPNPFKRQEASPAYAPDTPFSVDNSSTSSELYPDEKIAKEIEDQGDNTTAFGDKSPGVRRIEAIARCFTSWHKYVLFFTIFLIAYAYGLDLTLRYLYQNIALSSFGTSAQISTVAVVRSIVAAAAQPAFAKISDYFGRLSILFIAIVFWLIGSILNAAAKDLDVFLGGAVLYQFGYTGIQLLVEVVIGDTTSLRNRLFFSYIPAMPFLLNAWVSGYIFEAVMETTTWRWGVGMWIIIFPVCCLPLFGSLFHAEVRAKRKGYLDGIPSPFKSLGNLALWKDFFWQIDVIGLVLLCGAFITVLLPFTLAGGAESIWKTARVIAPLVVGLVVLFPAFILWEMKFARHPAIPFRVLKDRQIIAGITIACLLNTAWYCQGDYLFYTLQVSFDQDNRRTAWIQNIYSFVSVIIGLSLGLIVRHVRRLKWFVVGGTAIFVLAFGILYRYRSATHGGLTGFVAGEVLLGIGGGMFPYPTQALVQSAVQHERLAVITSLYLASYSIGSALGNTIAAGIWINHLPGQISKQFDAFGIDNATLATEAFASPLTFIVEYPTGTPAREALRYAYSHVQRLLCIAGLSISILIFLVSLTLKNPYLGDKQTSEDAEGVVVPARGAAMRRSQSEGVALEETGAEDSAKAREDA
ncbi:putative Siderochrome-iron uptake transporter [Papiliotrema laurentii]|uniref:Siderochrome-iron uptake transporter n=1 Tax=Papiliotrema laurentii TaxID=5418 RepID=A0AAD9FLR7_PAPLA|nr:putative Siderochrome-iron uptake transporter [Papiliotrema laurentii]